MLSTTLPSVPSSRPSQVEVIFSGTSESLYELTRQLKHPTGATIRFKPCLANRKLSDTITELGRDDRGIDPVSLLRTGPEMSAHRVAFLPKTRLLTELEQHALKAALSSVVDTGEYTTGPNTTILEEELGRFLDMPHVIVTSCGTDALIIALTALGVSSGDEVILPANSFAATENAVLATGARPVFCDVAPGSYNMDPSQIEKLITSRTRVLLPVHLYGKLADTRTMADIARRHGLRLLEDACQAAGLTGVGRHSDCAVLSMNPVKNFGICGKGGAIMTNDRELSLTCASIVYHGFFPGQKDIKQLDRGYNSRLDNLLATGALALLPHLALNNLRRTILAQRYLDLLAPLEHTGQLILPRSAGDNVWHLFPIQLAAGTTAQGFRHAMERHGVESGVFYPVLSHLQDTPFARGARERSSLANTELAHSRLVHLPLHQNLTRQEQDRVIECTHAVLRQSR